MKIPETGPSKIPSSQETNPKIDTIKNCAQKISHATQGIFQQKMPEISLEKHNVAMSKEDPKITEAVLNNFPVS